MDRFIPLVVVVVVVVLAVRVRQGQIQGANQGGQEVQTLRFCFSNTNCPELLDPTFLKKITPLLNY